MKKAIVVLPTYNEKENITPILLSILKQQRKITGYRLHILVVDDCSPDGTGNIVKNLAKKYLSIHLLSGTKQGLGAAYIRGFTHAIYKLNADVIFEMDADFSHDPNDIPRLLKYIDKGYDFVIGSRYISGGSIPANWSILRKFNSKWGNLFARYVAGLSDIHDCTGGYRAIKKEVIEQINLDKLHVKGYSFQISLLNQALKAGTKIKETPIKFIDRKHGESKIRLKDIQEFVIHSFSIRVTNISISLFSEKALY